MSSIHIEVLLASGYALFLVAVATCLEKLGRHTHQRSRQYQTAGFTYHQHINVWECPAGQYLKLWAFDSQRQVAQYRAEAKSCNSCALKKNCTDSEDGRNTGAPPSIPGCNRKSAVFIVEFRWLWFSWRD